MKQHDFTRREGVKAMAAAGLIGALSGCGVVARTVREKTTGLASPGPTDKERARIAWQYFRTARASMTGLTETVAGGGFSTTQTLADQIAGISCAFRLGVIDRRECDAAISQVMVFMGSMPLAGGQLPGRFYSSDDGKLMDPPERGRDPGWSGVQVGRLLLWLRALVTQFPQYGYAIAGIVDRWQSCLALAPDGTILQGLPGAGGLVTSPDLASGYGVAAAEGYRAWGMPARVEVPSGDYTVTVEGAEFPIGTLAAPVAPLHVAPFALLGIERGWDGLGGASLAAEKNELGRIFAAQERRRQKTGIVTARSDFRRNSAPYTLVGSVVAAGTPWNTLGDGGQSYPALALQSTKAAFAMWALSALGAKEAMAAVSTLYDANLGWLEGRYEASGGYEWTRSAATNAFVLEALLYREVGAVAKVSGGALTPGGATGFACERAGA